MPSADAVPELVVSAEVTQGYLPVLNATVFATVTFQDNNGTDIPDIHDTVMLKDDGLGKAYNVYQDQRSGSKIKVKDQGQRTNNQTNQWRG